MIQSSIPPIKGKVSEHIGAFQTEISKPESGSTEDTFQLKGEKSSKINIEMSKAFERFAKKEINLPSIEVPKNNTPFTLRLWDLGGQNEFINTHHLFLDVGATTLIVMDITKKIHDTFKGKIKLGNPKTPAEVLCYWLNSFHVQGSRSGITPNIAVVLTHTDLVKTEDIQHYTDDIKLAVQGKPYATLISDENIYTADNKHGTNDDFQNMRNNLLHSFAKQKSWGAKIPAKYQMLEADLVEKVSIDNIQYIELSNLQNLGRKIWHG